MLSRYRLLKTSDFTDDITTINPNELMGAGAGGGPMGMMGPGAGMGAGANANDPNVQA